MGQLSPCLLLVFVVICYATVAVDCRSARSFGRIGRANEHLAGSLSVIYCRDFCQRVCADQFAPGDCSMSTCTCRYGPFRLHVYIQLNAARNRDSFYELHFLLYCTVAKQFVIIYTIVFVGHANKKVNASFFPSLTMIRLLYGPSLRCSNERSDAISARSRMTYMICMSSEAKEQRYIISWRESKCSFSLTLSWIEE